MYKTTEKEASDNKTYLTNLLKKWPKTNMTKTKWHTQSSQTLSYIMLLKSNLSNRDSLHTKVHCQFFSLGFTDKMQQSSLYQKHIWAHNTNPYMSGFLFFSLRHMSSSVVIGCSWLFGVWIYATVCFLWKNVWLLTACCCCIREFNIN